MAPRVIAVPGKNTAEIVDFLPIPPDARLVETNAGTFVLFDHEAADYAQSPELLKESEAIGIGPEGKRGVWRTIGGNPIFIEVQEGESIPEAVRRAGEPASAPKGPPDEAGAAVGHEVIAASPAELPDVSAVAGRARATIKGMLKRRADRLNPEWLRGLQMRSVADVRWSGGRAGAAYYPEQRLIAFPQDYSPGITFFHELGHHVLQTGLTPEERQRLPQLAAARAGMSEKVRRRLAVAASPEHVARHPREYFAESFRAFVEEPKVLQKYDPEIYAVIEAARTRRRTG